MRDLLKDLDSAVRTLRALYPTGHADSVFTLSADAMQRARNEIVNLRIEVEALERELERVKK